jgi:predicted alpha/beta superfamily hydrolase
MASGRLAEKEGRIRLHKRLESRYASTRREVVVYLPPGYDSGARARYPVLYLQDGQNLFDPATAFAGNEWRADAVADEAISAGRVRPLIIAGVYNGSTRRISEFTPTRNATMRKGGKASNYTAMLIREIKPLIDSTYPTAKGCESTGIGGSSLGGLLALTAGLAEPRTFGRVAAISPSVWWDGRVVLNIVEKWQGTKRPRIWMDIGTNEGDSPQVTVQDARALRDALAAKGWKEGADLQYREVPGAQHNEYAWGSRFSEVLEYLFPAEPLPA